MLQQSSPPLEAELFLIVPAHNRREVTAAFASQLKEQSFQNFKLILVDDGSTDGTADAVCNILPQHTIVIKGDGNLWWAASLNKAFDFLEDHKIPNDAIIGITNDDVILQSKNYLELAYNEVRAYPNAFTASRRVPEKDAPYCQHGAVLKWAPFRVEVALSDLQADCTSTRGLFFLKKSLQISGKMRPKLLPHYLSDYEFTFRAHKRGIPLRIAQELTLSSMANDWNAVCPNYEKDTLFEIIKKNRDNRNNLNPIDFSIFAFLCAPKRKLWGTLISIWSPIVKTICKRVFRGDKSLLFKTSI